MVLSAANKLNIKLNELTANFLFSTSITQHRIDNSTYKGFSFRKTLPHCCYNLYIIRIFFRKVAKAKT